MGITKNISFGARNRGNIGLPKELFGELIEAQKVFAERFLVDYLGIYTPFVEDTKVEREAIKYCPYCGKRIEERNNEVNESWRCPKCGKYHFYDYERCQYCGKGRE